MFSGFSHYEVYDIAQVAFFGFLALLVAAFLLWCVLSTKLRENTFMSVVALVIGVIAFMYSAGFTTTAYTMYSGHQAAEHLEQELSELGFIGVDVENHSFNDPEELSIRVGEPCSISVRLNRTPDGFPELFSDEAPNYGLHVLPGQSGICEEFSG